MKTNRLFIAACGVALLSAATCCLAALVFPWAKLTVRVLDDDGKPLEGATVRMGFEMPDRQVWGTTNTKVNGQTNVAGEFSGAAECATGHVGFYADMPGYYSTSGKSLDLRRGVTGTYWTPWNSVQTLTLKKIINPVPMYALKRTVLELPVENEPAGFDLVAHDWVAPYGKGMTADFVFKLIKRINSPIDYSGQLRLSFSNSGDGIQRLDPVRNNGLCELRSPQIALADHYEPVLALLTGTSLNNEGDHLVSVTSRGDDNYLFRVRTIRREDGTILSACYGKIYGPIEYDMSGLKHLGPPHLKTSIVLSYYLNPDDQSRSLEYDTKRNLFTKLRSYDNPNEP